MRRRFGETRFKSITQKLPGYNFFNEQYIEHSSNTDYIMYYTHDQFYFIIQMLHTTCARLNYFSLLQKLYQL